jgi:hypothetical protein
MKLNGEYNCYLMGDLRTCIIKTSLDGVQHKLGINVLDSEDENKAKLSRLDN